MLLSKLKVAAWALAVVAAVGVGAVGWTYRASAQPPGPAGGAPGPAPGGTHAARADDLEALRLEVEALRVSLQATRERVKTLEEEVQSLKGPGQAGPPGMSPFGTNVWPRPGATMAPGNAPGAAPGGTTTVRPGAGDGPAGFLGGGPGSPAAGGSAPHSPGFPGGGPGLAPPGGSAPGPGAGSPSVPGGAPTPGFVGAVEGFLRGAESDPAAEAEAALKKYRQRPDDKQALEELERAVHRLKEAKGRPEVLKPAAP